MFKDLKYGEKITEQITDKTPLNSNISQTRANSDAETSVKFVQQICKTKLKQHKPFLVQHKTIY